MISLADRTKAQSHKVSFLSDIGQYDEEILSGKGRDWVKLVQEMQCDPTIALVRYLYAAIPAVAGWSIEKKKDAPIEAEDLIDEELMKFRLPLIRSAMLGCADFGWQPYEIILSIRSDMQTGIKKIKPLLQDMTEIRVLRKTGAFNGLRQYDVDGAEVLLDTWDALLLYMDIEGTDWFGNGLMKNAVTAYKDKRSTSDTAARYDKKIAGANWIIKYPEGTSFMDGVEVNNSVVANAIGAQLQASGVLTVPKNVNRMINDMVSSADGNTYEWEIELITADGSAAGFTDRLSYLDKLLVRAFGFPERSILEGQFGTKAEAGEHINMTFAVLQLRHDEMVNLINWHLVNKLLVSNYGPEAADSVYIVANPIIDEQRTMMRELYNTILGNQASFMNEWDNMDLSAIRETLNIPTIDNELFGDELLPEIAPIDITGQYGELQVPLAI